MGTRFVGARYFYWAENLKRRGEEDCSELLRVRAAVETDGILSKIALGGTL